MDSNINYGIHHRTRNYYHPKMPPIHCIMSIKSYAVSFPSSKESMPKIETHILFRQEPWHLNTYRPTAGCSQRSISTIKTHYHSLHQLLPNNFVEILVFTQPQIPIFKLKIPSSKFQHRHSKFQITQNKIQIPKQTPCVSGMHMGNNHDQYAYARACARHLRCKW